MVGNARWYGPRRGASRRVRVLLLTPTLLMAAASASAVACSSATASDSAAESSIPVAASSSVSVTAAPPLLDERGERLKEALGEAGLASGLTDGTVLAVARGLCDQVAAGLPEERILDTVRPIATYAASVSGTALSGDDAARRFVETTVGSYC